MSQILEDLKKGFKAVDEFYTNKIREPIVSFIKSCSKVYKSAKHDSISHNSNEHAVKTTFEPNDEYVSNQISAGENLIERHDISTNDNDIL